MLTEKDYCDYDTCVALKELGYIGQGRCYYDLDKEPNKLRYFGIQVLTTRSAEALNFILAIHLYDAQKWLREEKDTHIVVNPTNGQYYCTILLKDKNPILLAYEGIVVKHFDSYEEALLEGIKEAVKVLKEK